MSLFKRDWWKILCFLFVWFVLQKVDYKFNPLDGVLITVVFFVLQGLLPYMAKQANPFSQKQPLVVFLILEVLLMFVKTIALPLWVLHVLVILDAVIFFLLMMVVFGRCRYSVKPLATHWGKCLEVVVVFYLAEMFVIPFLYHRLYGPVHGLLAGLLVPLLYIGITYSLVAPRQK